MQIRGEKKTDKYNLREKLIYNSLCESTAPFHCYSTFHIGCYSQQTTNEETTKVN